MIVMKTFFSAIPESLEESAFIDGANDLVIMVRVILPLSMPAIATITLFYAVGYWNSYFNVMMYVNSSSLKVLQQVLRDLVNSSGTTDQLMDSADQAQTIATESIKAVAIVIATQRSTVVYPFLQKYFVRGVMIGAIKG